MKKHFQKLLVIIITAIVLIPSFVEAKSTITIDKKSYIYTESRKEAKFHTNKGYAYCITPHRTGPGQGTSLSYVSKQTSGGVLYLLDNAGTSDSEYLATQLAIWQYDSNYMPDFYINHSGYEVVKKAKALAAEAAKNKNYKASQPSVKINISSDKLSITSDGKYYRSGVITATLSYATTAKLSLSGAPNGTQIINKSNNSINSINNNGVFYIQVPATSVTANSSFTLKASVTGKISSIERYTTGNSKWQDLIVLVREDKTITDSQKLTVAPIKRTCEFFNGQYYDKNGNITDKTTYSIQCEKHTCEKVGDTYFGSNGKQVDKTTYSIQCEKHTCEKVGNTYFGSNGKQVDKTTYSIQCEKHTCEVVGNVYFGKNGQQTDKTNYTIECEKHSCEKIGNTYFGKNGNKVSASVYDLECNKHICEKVGNTYFGKGGYEVEELTYQKECFNHNCEKIGDTYYGKDGSEVSEDNYNKQCFAHTCEKVGDTYYGEDGSEVDYGQYTIQCEKHTCEYINGSYFGKDGSKVNEDEYINQCIHTCEIYNNQYFGSQGTVVSETEYKAQCEAQVVPVPDTASGIYSGLISVIIGSAMIGTVVGIISYYTTKKHA